MQEGKMPLGSYANFDLLIDQAPNGYRARVIRSLTGETAVEFTLPFTDDELADFFWRSFGRGRHLGAKPDGEGAAPVLDARGFGQRLYAAVFAGGVGVCLRRSLDKAQAQNQGLRIRLRLDPGVPALAELPWEYLFATDLDRFLALSDATPLVRYLEVAEGVEALRVAPPLAILAVIASPSDVTPLAVEEEWRRLQTALADLQARHLIHLERLNPATWPALQARLRQGPVHLLHFIGHGRFDSAAGTGGLIFENAAGHADEVSAGTLAMLLHDHAALRLIFLNACEGARSGRSDSFAGVAQRLVRQGIPAVLAMQFPVSDAAAIALSQAFYSALADGYPADSALSEARKAIAAQGNPLEWGTPVLYSRSDDNRLIELPQGDRRAAIEHKPFEPESILISAGPFLLGTAQGSGAPGWEMPRQTLALPGYRIGKYPVTNSQYLAFARDKRIAVAPETGFELAPVGQAPPAGKENHPVVGITWDDAVAYCRWLSDKTGRIYRLPSEAEWEKAASWGTEADKETDRQVDEERKRRYPWGDTFDATKCNTAESGIGTTTAVGTYSDKGGDSPCGVADMAGNVWEWTSTRWGTERSQPQYVSPYDPGDGRENQDKDEPFREYRIVRGGSYQDGADRAICTARGRDAADKGSPRRGFRVAMDI
jgi:formylglycine-generating enzyme required for sulfatase activity